MTVSTIYDRVFEVDYSGVDHESKTGFFRSTKGKVFVGSLAAIVVISTAALTMASQDQQQVEVNSALSAPIAESTAKFSLDLYKDVADNVGSSENIFFSPVSISAALGMTFAGASGNTASEMVSALHLPSDPAAVHAGFEHLLGQLKGNENYTLETANRMYVNRGFKLLENFKGVLEKHYLASAETVDFGDEPTARAAINNWVEEITRQKIKDLIAPGILNDLTRLVLVNAIYFKGTWEKTFDKESTHDRDFHVSASSTIQVPMMRMTKNFRLGYIEELKTRVLELPYKDPKLSMLIFLPNEIEGIKDLEANIQKLPLLNLDSILESTKVQIVIPKFKIELQMNLNDHLKNLGIKDVFDERRADLSGVTGNKDLVVSHVIHKAFVEVNEEGSEAAAATAVIMMLRSMPIIMTPPFVADHPFLFMIMDSVTKSVLFLGRLAAPQ